jgi:hypothetical protein
MLSHDQRIAFDGTPAETVDAGPKDMPTKQLARLDARNPGKRRHPDARETILVTAAVYAGTKHALDIRWVIAAEMGWSLPYTLSVLATGKWRRSTAIAVTT